MALDEQRLCCFISISLPSFLQRSPERVKVPLPCYPHENKLLLVE